MPKRVLIIGGYGNFGGAIARALAGDSAIQLLIGGRSLAKANRFIEQCAACNRPEAIMLDVTEDITSCLDAAKPDIVIHTTGPFQGQDYVVAEACLKQGCHYIDLADARQFVSGIVRYDQQAREKKLLIISGASSVPCLTSAVIDSYRPYFLSLDKVEYGISAAQRTNRGLATVSAILSYVGKPFMTLTNGKQQAVYGWQGMHAEKYPELGWRLLGNCDIPDLELFPRRYPELKTIRFSAGIEVPALHIGLWFLSWLVRFGIVPSLQSFAARLLKISFLFDCFGTEQSGFHMLLSGVDKDGNQKTERFYIIARSGHGPFIPCMPAILLAQGLASGRITAIGAQPCLDLIDLDSYCAAFKDLDVSVITAH